MSGFVTSSSCCADGLPCLVLIDCSSGRVSESSLSRACGADSDWSIGLTVVVVLRSEQCVVLPRSGLLSVGDVGAEGVGTQRSDMLSGCVLSLLNPLPAQRGSKRSGARKASDPGNTGVTFLGFVCAQSESCAVSALQEHGVHWTIALKSMQVPDE